MIVIDGKAHRNMPEQVAKNQKDIEDIFNTLDGLNIQDNVVAIADLSHILTQDELEIVNRAVAFIVYNDHLFIKRDQDATNAYFDIVFSISGSTVISFNSDEMQVNLTTGALTLVSNTFATYSKTQLDTLLATKSDVTYVNAQLALKANLTGANFTGNISAPKFIGVTQMENIEDSAGHKRFIAVAPTYVVDFLAALNPYIKCTLCGTHLMIVCAFNINNGDTFGGAYTPLVDFTLPEWIYNKLIGMAGGAFLDSKEISGYSSSFAELTRKIKYSIYKTTNNRVRIQWEAGAAYTWTETGTYRIVLDLLVDND